jgi:hypothetical protein
MEECITAFQMSTGKNCLGGLTPPKNTMLDRDLQERALYKCQGTNWGDNFRIDLGEIN